MKKQGMVLISMALAFILSANTFAAGIATVDIQKILLTVNQGKKVREKLKKKFDEKQKILKNEEAAIRKLQESFKKQSLVMNDKAKLQKEREIQEKIIGLQQKSVTFQKEIQEMEQKLKKPILEKIRSVVDEVSKSGGFDMTFELSTAPIFVKKSANITDKVIALYNKKNK